MLDESRLPPELRAAARQFNDLAGQVEGKAMRLRQLRPPDVPKVSPEQLAAEAGKPDASPRLRAVAEAVRAGKTSWAEIADGKANDLPEVRALRAETARELLTRAVDAYQAAQQQGPPPEPDEQAEPVELPAGRPAARPKLRPRPDDPDEDFSAETYLA